MKYKLLIIYALSLFVSCTSRFTAEDILIANFEGSNYGKWTATGEAFGKGPAQGIFPGQTPMEGMSGKGLVNSFLNKDASTGMLTSPLIAIERNYITFLIGGGISNSTSMQLLSQGQVIQSCSGRNSGNLFIDMFDVRKFKGEPIQLRIVDENTGGWGHILVDHIVMTDIRPESIPLERNKRIKLTGKYLLIPIHKNGKKNAKKGQLEIYIGETLAHRMDVHIADKEDDIAWWSAIPMQEYIGKTATIKYPAAIKSEALDLIESSNNQRNIQTMYNESLRPQLRFSQMYGWNNDPNGMVYYDGEYHLFWQSNPFATYHSNMYWGHAVSKDMIYWKELPWAMRPFGRKDENRHPSMADGKCFSGGATVDFNNTLGLQKDDTKTLIATFTDTEVGESIAYSTDKGRNWIYYHEINPVIKHKGRDPKPFWYEPGKHWVIAVFDEQKERGGQNISIYISKDLKRWEYTSHVNGFFECPELFELPIDGDNNNKRWVMMAANCKYLIGSFDGKTFMPEHKEQKETIVGEIFNAIYAGQCFSNTPNGRVTYIGWAGMTKQADPNTPFHNGFTLPIDFSLRTTSDGPRLFAEPVEEFDMLRDSVVFNASNQKLDENSNHATFKTDGQEFDIVLKVQALVKNSKAQLNIGETIIPIDLTMDDPKWRFVPNNGKMGTAVLRVVCDRPFMEVISANGRRYQMINRTDKGKGLGDISLKVSKGNIEITEFKIYAMKSIWK